MYKYKDFSPTQIKNILVDYSNNIYLSRPTLCQKYNISDTTLKSMIKNAILKSYIPLETCYRIKEKSVSNAIIAQGQKARKRCESYYDELIKQRADYKAQSKNSSTIINSKNNERIKSFDDDGNLSGYNDYTIPDEKNDDE